VSGSSIGCTSSTVLPSDTRQDCLLDPVDNPGLGTEYHEDASAAYEYSPAYLPINRLADGSMHD